MSIHPTAKTPEELRPHLGDYFPDSWRNYTLQELGTFVYLLTTRSLMRGSPEKRAKDLYSARNYWRMIGAHLDAHEHDAESHGYDFESTPGMAGMAAIISPEESPAGDGLEMGLTELDRLVGAPPLNLPAPPGDMEEQEPPAGDEDLMGEIESAPGLSAESEFVQYTPGTLDTDASDSPDMDKPTTTAVERVPEVTPPAPKAARRPRRSRTTTKKGKKA